MRRACSVAAEAVVPRGRGLPCRKKDIPQDYQEVNSDRLKGSLRAHDRFVASGTSGFPALSESASWQHAVFLRNTKSVPSQGSHFSSFLFVRGMPLPPPAYIQTQFTGETLRNSERISVIGWTSKKQYGILVPVLEISGLQDARSGYDKE